MVLFISQYRFPEGDAGSERTLYLAQAFQKAGYEVLVVGHGAKDKKGIQKGVPYLSLRVFFSRIISRLLWYHRLIKTIALLGKRHIDAMVVSNLERKSLVYLKEWCKMQNVAFIYDAVEWYDARQFKEGDKSKEYISNNELITHFIDSDTRVIAISSYLNEYFLSKNIKSVNVPVLFNQGDARNKEKTHGDILTLQYAGSPGRKDSLDEMLMGLYLLNDKELAKVRCNLIGVTETQARELLGDDVIDRLLPSLCFYGRRPMSFVREMMAFVDFNILLRNDAFRNVKAGFPTKVVEGVSYYTPFIMNLTSDLGTYFTDGVDCIEVKSFSAISFKNAVERALSLSVEEREKMSFAAKNTAVHYFDISCYIDRLLYVIN